MGVHMRNTKIRAFRITRHFKFAGGLYFRTFDFQVIFENYGIIMHPGDFGMRCCTIRVEEGVRTTSIELSARPFVACQCIL